MTSTSNRVAKMRSEDCIHAIATGITVATEGAIRIATINATIACAGITTGTTTGIAEIDGGGTGTDTETTHIASANAVSTTASMCAEIRAGTTGTTGT